MCFWHAFLLGWRVLLRQLRKGFGLRVWWRFGVAGSLSEKVGRWIPVAAQHR